MISLKELLNEDGKDIRKVKKHLKVAQNGESRLRLAMYELVQTISKDKANIKLANQLIKSYQKNVTKFMRDMIATVKKVK
jgi:hypothetical protein|tara:strand:+ start:113 stop:352 length:240 start_codon:yes stop_codon:yes gene_type:complete